MINSVARGWLLAGVVAVLLAAGVGWLISRQMSGPLLALAGVTARMAGGDLAARADVRQQDEFGLLARSFNDMAERLEGTIVTLRRFVADAAHELRTPLTALKTDLELAAGEGRNADRTASLAHAQAQVDRLASLSAGLFDLAHRGRRARRDGAGRSGRPGAAGERGLRVTGRAGRADLCAAPAGGAGLGAGQRRAAPTRPG